MQKIGLGGYFDAVSDGNNITHSKPDPEVILKAAQMFCLQPEDCLVVEDAVSGATAGHLFWCINLFWCFINRAYKIITVGLQPEFISGNSF